VPTALDNGIRSPRKLLAAVVTRLLGREKSTSRPEPAAPPVPRVEPGCSCFVVEQNFWWSGATDDVAEYRRRRHGAGDVSFHVERQDTDCDAWKKLLELVEKAAAERATTFAPLRNLDPGDETRIVTLPPTIARLKAVKRLELYGSHLVRIPPEIGEMSSLEDFDPYTSYRLHWFPYEITRCSKLHQSRVSTRVLYGNFKLRPPFPRLEADTFIGDFPSGPIGTESERRCSVCARPLGDSPPQRVWISLWVGSDVLPLLVNACSEECIRDLPTPAEGYVQEPHRGGLEVEQPDRGFT
jgi:hypothetical protein